ncbi:MAG: AAA family ATPase [Microthrixaceae bacterium]|nr:AAA family ATPase [Microthrixaceae bacterium]
MNDVGGGGTCGSCGAPVGASARFCGQCAAPVTDGGGEERRQVTVLFTDASGYTELAEDLDPETVRELMASVYEEAESVVARYGGRVDKLMGDAVLAVFGDPVAHEDDAERATRAALDIHAAVQAMAQRFEAAAGRSVTMHSGVNTGVIVTGAAADLRSGPLGDMVNVAARLQSLAGPGEILIGPETRTLVEGRVSVTDLGPRTLKGRREPVEVARVDDAGTPVSTPSRRVGDFIGRHEELGVLLGAVDRVRDGEASVVTVRGEAGAGKTRLLEEFRSRLDDDVQWLEGRAYPYTTNIPYAAVVDLVNRAAGIDERDHAEVVAAKLADTLDGVVPDHPLAYVTLAQLYDLAPPDQVVDLESFRAHLHAVMRDVVDAVARRGPTVVCLQDLHWVDPSTADLVRHLAATDGEPIVTVCNFRPGFSLDAEGERLVELRELSPRQTREHLVSLLDDEEPPEQLVDAVLARTDGNPFFVEEIVNRLLETAVLARDDGRWVLRRHVDEVDLPSTVRGVLAARIDSLDGHHRRLLREASVVGREFLHRVVSRVAAQPEALDQRLSGLVSADLIHEKETDPELEYAFKHALTQEVAYDGLPRAQREQLHEQVARAIEEVLGDRTGEFVETLAYHYERSGHVEEAVGYLKRAGRKALDRDAKVEADEQYRRAYDLLVAGGGIEPDARDRLLLELLLDWAQVHYYQGRFGDLRELFESHEALPGMVGDDALAARWLAWSGHLHQNVCGELPESIDLLEAALALGRTSGDATAEAYARAWLPWALYLAGRGDEVAGHWERLLALLPEVPDPHDRRYVHIKGMGGMATVEAIRGNTVAARRLADELFAVGADTGNRRAVAMAYAAMIAVHVGRGDLDAAIATCEVADEQDFDPVYRHVGRVWSAGLQAMLLDPEDARRTIEVTEPEARALGLNQFADFHEVSAALIELNSGNLSRAMRTLERLHADLGAKGNVWAQVAMIDLSVATLHARLATGAAEGSFADALRNPGFVVRHVRGAGRRGRAELEALLDTLPARHFGCYLPAVHLELAELARHEGRHDDARRHAEAVLEALADEPDATHVIAARMLLEG